MDDLLLHLLRLLGMAVIGTVIVRLFTLHSARRRAAGIPPHPWFGRFTPQVPNAMSLLRIPLGLWILLVVALPTLQTKPAVWTAHLAFLLVCLFDALDGYFARKWNVVSADGKSLDPAADKFVTLCLGTAAFWRGELAAWAFILLAAREAVSLVQRARLQRQDRDVSARWLGKLKTPIQFAVLYLLVLRSPALPVVLGLELPLRALPAALVQWGVLLMCFFTVISIFPFFAPFSYVNRYAPADPGRLLRPWLLRLIPNLFTVGNYLCGITAVFFALPRPDAPAAAPFVSLFWLLAAGLCEALDGPLARKFNTLSEFGACLASSMALSTFGLATSCVIFFQLSGLLALHGLAAHPLIARLAAGVVALSFFTAVHTWLARASQREPGQPRSGAKPDFVGMPAPAGAIGALILFIFLRNPFLIALLILSLAALMASRFNYPSLATLGRLPFYRFIFIPAVLLAFIVLYLLMFFYPFLSHNSLRDITPAFHLVAWLLFPGLIIYALHGLGRGFVRI